MIRFVVHPEKILVESNEDGFLIENVKAICSTGESSKSENKDVTSSPEGYIGEKGIGFKSVFKIAKRVKVQSGAFSFAFEYEDHLGSDGLGMVTPLDAEPEELPSDIKTRISLTLLESIASEAQFSKLFQVADPLLLFLNTLERIEVQKRFTTEACIITYTYAEDDDGEVTLRKTIKIGNGLPVGETTQYRLHTMDVTDLPIDHDRTRRESASISLAFPLDESGKPSRSKLKHDIFAYLPMARVGFPVSLDYHLLSGIFQFYSLYFPHYHHQI